MDIHYSSERAVQIIIYLLKAHGIKNVIASPGATNVTFVASVQSDPFFNIYSCVDERSAAYMACGVAAQSGEPVVLSCTGATSSRNYLPGLTEAYYRNLPVLAITSMMIPSVVGNLFPQATDRSNPPKDAIKRSYHIPAVSNAEEDWKCTNCVNEAILELTRRGGGPVHLRLTTLYSKDYSVKEIAPVRVIRRLYACDEFPSLQGKRIAIFVGAHLKWNDKETAKVEEFCTLYNSVVLCDRTSNYFGAHHVNYALVGSQEYGPILDYDVLIHLGSVSGDYYTCGRLQPKEVWRIDLDGEFRDRFRCLTKVFEMEEFQFFSKYVEKAEHGTKDNVASELKQSYNELYSKIPDLPFSNIWIASVLNDKLPDNSILYLGIFNSLRAWNFFEIPNNIVGYSNVGGFGIDGMNSSILGAALVQPDKLFLGVSGDLGFFYDINTLGNRHFPSNLRIMVVNNGLGQEFKNYKNATDWLGDYTEEYIAAARHNGNKSPLLTKHISEDLGFEYISASSKEEFMNVYTSFVSAEIGDKPMIFEVFTDTNDERNALRMMMNINKAAFSDTIKEGFVTTAKKILSPESKKILRNLFKK